MKGIILIIRIGFSGAKETNLNNVDNSAINPININEGNYFNYSHWFQL